MKKNKKSIFKSFIKKSKEKKETKKKKLPFRRTLENNAYALKIVQRSAPLFMVFFFLITINSAIIDFLSGPFLLRMIVNDIELGRDGKKIVLYIVYITCFTIFARLISNYFGNVISNKMIRKMVAAVQKQMFKKAGEVELACYENPEFYDKYVKAMDEAPNRIYKVIRTLDSALWRVVSLAANSFLLFLIDPWLIIFGIIPLLLGIIKAKEKKIKHDYEMAQKPFDRRKKYVQRVFYLNEYAKEVRLTGMYHQIIKDWWDNFEEFKINLRKYSFKQALLGYISKVGLEVFVILGATLYALFQTVVRGVITKGDCLVIVSSIGTMAKSLNNMANTAAEFNENAIYIEDMRFFLEYEPKIKENANFPDAIGKDIIIENLSFSYDGSENEALKNINLTIHNGERIAIVGQNGSGKSTLIKLILHLYQPTSGEIRLDDTNICSFNLSSYRERFGVVFQDYKNFSMTVSENVLLRPIVEGDEEIVIKALKDSGAYKKISSFEKGINTVLTREFDEKGAVLSGGENQKVSLARIFAQNKDCIILDEPSSALDPIAEYQMFENMMRATVGKTVIFISHRLSSTVLADKVYLMDKGEIVESGNHRQLMSLGGQYAEMFTKQAENYLGEVVGA